MAISTTSGTTQDGQGSTTMPLKPKVAEEHPTESKLDKELQELVILRLAEFVDGTEINKELQRCAGITLNSSTFTYYRREKEKQIQEKRKSLNLYLDNVPCANKSYRLKRIQTRLTALGKYSELDAKDQRLELELLEQARKEREGFKASIGIHPEPLIPGDMEGLTREGLESAIQQAKLEEKTS